MDLNKSITDNLMEHLSTLGDEEEIKQKYPEVFKLLHNTKKHQKLSNSHLPKMKLKTYDVEEDNPPKENSLLKNEIKYLTYTKSTDKMQCSILSLHKESREVISADGGISIDGVKKITISYRVTNESMLNLNINSGIENALNDSKDHTVKCEIKFSWIEVVNNTRIVKEDIKTYPMTIVGSPQQLVKKVTVTAPTPHTTHGENTLVLYHRKAKNDIFDYSYDNVINSNGKVNIHIPFSGKVQLLPDCQVLAIDLKNSSMYLVVNNKDIADNKNLLLNMINIDPSTNTLEWEFQDNWNAPINVHSFGANNIVDFYCKLAVQYFDKVFNTIRTVDLIFDSMANDDPTNIATQKIHKIQILYGCFHKDTLITMSDGTKKLVSQIALGDKIKSKDNLISTVSNLYTGQEDELICIETKKGKTLKVTRFHPILTTEGFISAEDLHAAMILITYDGEDEILYLYPDEYGDTVYNLDTDDGNPVIADDIFAGDFHTQTSYAADKAGSLEQNQLQKELLEVFDSMHKA